MASDKTANYGLSKWENWEEMLRKDLNHDHDKIDEVLHKLDTRTSHLLQTASGSYTGTGTTSHTIQMGFKPQFVLISRAPVAYQQIFYLGNDTAFELDQGGGVGYICTNDYFQVRAVENGLSLLHRAAWDVSQLATAVCNSNGVTYHWFALG